MKKTFFKKLFLFSPLVFLLLVFCSLPTSFSAEAVSGTQNGGGMIINKNTSFNFSGSIKNKSAYNGAGIYLEPEAQLTLSSGAEISKNMASGNGGAVTLNAFSVLNLNGGKISENQAVRGGGVYSANTSTINMNGSEISGNYALESGGGVHIADALDFYFDSGSIINNSATEKGGGIYVGSYSTLHFNGGVIADNHTEKGLFGYDVYVEQYGNFITKGGRIGSSSKTDVQTIFVEDDADFIYSGGEIYGYIQLSSYAMSYNVSINTTPTRPLHFNVSNIQIGDRYFYCSGLIPNEDIIVDNLPSNAELSIDEEGFLCVRSKSRTLYFRSNNTNYGTVYPSYLVVPLNSTISISGRTLTVTQPDGTRNSVTAQPTSSTSTYQYNFKNWDVSSGTKVTQDMTITAVFERLQYYEVTFQVSSTGYNGSAEIEVYQDETKLDPASAYIIKVLEGSTYDPYNGYMELSGPDGNYYRVYLVYNLSVEEEYVFDRWTQSSGTAGRISGNVTLTANFSSANWDMSRMFLVGKPTDYILSELEMRIANIFGAISVYDLTKPSDIAGVVTYFMSKSLQNLNDLGEYMYRTVNTDAGPSLIQDDLGKEIDMYCNGYLYNTRPDINLGSSANVFSDYLMELGYNHNEWIGMPSYPFSYDFYLPDEEFMVFVSNQINPGRVNGQCYDIKQYTGYFYDSISYASGSGRSHLVDFLRENAYTGFLEYVPKDQGFLDYVRQALSTGEWNYVILPASEAVKLQLYEVSQPIVFSLTRYLQARGFNFSTLFTTYSSYFNSYKDVFFDLGLVSKTVWLAPRYLNVDKDAVFSMLRDMYLADSYSYQLVEQADNKLAVENSYATQYNLRTYRKLGLNDYGYSTFISLSREKYYDNKKFYLDIVTALLKGREKELLI